MKCSQCGYQNKPEADSCNLCHAVLRKAVKRPAAGAATVEIKAPLMRHFLEAVGSNPLEIVPGFELTIGRQPNCTLSIPSSRVSRLHAVVRWEGEQPILVDKGSSNGTFIRGKRVKEHPLKDGDEIEIGPYLCVYRLRDPLKADSDSDIADHTQTIAGMGDLLTGPIPEGGIAEIVQGLEFNTKTGTLDVFGREGEGWIAFDRGAPIAALANGKTEEEAILFLLGLKSGRFTFSPNLEVKEKRVKQTVTALLLEWGRRSDERFRKTETD